MLRSMFSAVSGLRSHQTMMDVVGNNVANVNTAGYKSSRTTFQEALTQVVRGGSGTVVDGAGTATQGGINPMQIGLGARVAGVDTSFGQGASQVTGRVTDLAIQGEGFFVVESGGQNYYTRAGAFSFDNTGLLVAPNGEIAKGWMATDVTDPATIDTTVVPPPDQIQIDPANDSDVTIGADGTVSARRKDPVAGTDSIVTIGRIALARFVNPNGLVRVGSGMYAVRGDAAGAEVNGAAGDAGFGNLQAGTLEMSNVDLAAEFTNLILAQRGFQANARTITASDEILQDLVNLKR